MMDLSAQCLPDTLRGRALPEGQATADGQVFNKPVAVGTWKQEPLSCLGKQFPLLGFFNIYTWAPTELS
jgi:hypothetical protein